LLNFCDNQLVMVQHLKGAKETWDFFKAMYEHVDRSMSLMVKKKFISLVIQEGKSTTFFWEKFQDLLNQMACVGLFVNDQDGVMQFLETWLAPYKIFVIVIRNMPMLTFFILMAKVQEEKSWMKTNRDLLNLLHYFFMDKPTTNKVTIREVLQETNKNKPTIIKWMTLQRRKKVIVFIVTWHDITSMTVKY